MAIHKEKFDASIVLGDVFVLSFSCSSLCGIFDRFDWVEYKLFARYRSSKTERTSLHIRLCFDQNFYNAISKPGYANLLQDKTLIHIKKKCLDNTDFWQIHIPCECFKQNEFSFSWKHIRIHSQVVSELKSARTQAIEKANRAYLKAQKRAQKADMNKALKELRSARMRSDPLFGVPDEAKNLYRTGFLFRVPDPLPRGLGRGHGKKTGGGKNFNANFITSINQGGRFTPK